MYGGQAPEGQEAATQASRVPTGQLIAPRVPSGQRTRSASGLISTGAQSHEPSTQLACQAEGPMGGKGAFPQTSRQSASAVQLPENGFGRMQRCVSPPQSAPAGQTR